MPVSVTSSAYRVTDDSHNLVCKILVDINWDYVSSDQAEKIERIIHEAGEKAAQVTFEKF